MDGENNGLNPYLKWMIWGENPLFSKTSIWSSEKKNDGKNPRNLQQDPRSTDPEKT